jgi:hypothetical protein
MNRLYSLALVPVAAAALGLCGPDEVSQSKSACKTWASYAVKSAPHFDDSSGCAYVQQVPMPGAPTMSKYIIHIANKKAGQTLVVKVTAPTGRALFYATATNKTFDAPNNRPPAALAKSKAGTGGTA